MNGKYLSDLGGRPRRTGKVSIDLKTELDYDSASIQQQMSEFKPSLNSK